MDRLVRGRLPAPRPGAPRSYAHQAERDLLAEGIVLDYRAYFWEFCSVHGEPVNVSLPAGNVLLFEDGFTYSDSSYRGPEWPPPDDPGELLKLRELYLVTRLDIMRDQAGRLSGIINRHSMLQQGRSLAVPMLGTGPGGERTDRLAEARESLAWLAEDISECLRELATVRQQVLPVTPSGEHQ